MSNIISLMALYVSYRFHCGALRVLKETNKQHEELVKFALLAHKSSNAKELSDAVERAKNADLQRLAIQDEMANYEQVIREQETAKRFEQSFTLDMVTDENGKLHKLSDLELEW
jgi:hypothetical protein